MAVKRPDLAARLRLRQAPLRRQLSRADVLADMIRAVNASLDPDRVADAMLARVASWLPVPSWLVLATDDQGQMRPMAVRALPAAITRVLGARRA